VVFGAYDSYPLTTSEMWTNLTKELCLHGKILFLFWFVLYPGMSQVRKVKKLKLVRKKKSVREVRENGNKVSKVSYFDQIILTTVLW